MPRVSCESPLGNYLIAAKDKYSSLSMSLSSVDRISPFARIQLVGKTIGQMIPVVMYGIKATALEMDNKEAYDTNVRYIFNDKNQMVYASGPYAGLRPRDLNDRTRRLNPGLYNPEDLKTDLLMEADFQAGATKVITVYPREGDDNRNLNIYELDPVTKTISLKVVNTATDGNNHDYSKIAEIAKQHFPDLDVILPVEHIFILSDVKIPEQEVERVMGEFGIKENGLEIREEKMRFDAEKGKVFTKDESGKEVDIESIAKKGMEQQQKHRLVAKIKSCHACAVSIGKTEAFFYAPDNLEEDKKERTISQILVDPKGNVMFKTAVLSSDLANSDSEQLLLKLGYKKEKTPHEFSYTDDPIPDSEMKKIINGELVLLKSQHNHEFLSLRVFPIDERFDLFRERLNSDRIITNIPPLYFHDIVVANGTTKVEGRVEKKEQKMSKEQVDHVGDALGAFVVITVRERTVIAVQKSKIERKTVKNIPGENIKALNQSVKLGEQIDRKKSKHHQNSDDNNSGGSPSKVNLSLDKPENDFVSNYTLQTMPKIYLEEEDTSDNQEIADDSAPGNLVFSIDGREIKGEGKTEEVEYPENPRRSAVRKDILQVSMDDAVRELACQVVHEDQGERVIDELKHQNAREVREVVANNHDRIQEEIIQKVVMQDVVIQVDEKMQSRKDTDSVSIPPIVNKIEKTQIVTEKAEDEEYKQTALMNLVTPPQIIFNKYTGEQMRNLQEAQAQRLWEMFVEIYFGMKIEDEGKNKQKILVSRQEVSVNFQNQQIFLQQYSRILAILLISLVNFISGQV